LRFLPKLLGREIRTIEIKKSYRNTLEIARYAEKVSGVSDLELLDRHGKEVVEKTFNTDMELLDELVCHLKCPGDFETAALITTTEEEAFDLSRLLQLRGINVSYVDRNSSAFKKGLTVTTFYLAKGLEFDQVFALRGAKENPLKNQAEYICATRALHELYIYETGTGNCIYVLDYPTDQWYINGNNAYLEDGIFYGASVRNGYAQSNTCFMFAYDLENDKLLWRSADQTYNSMNFVVKGNVILCGYGFTAEPDYLYQINRNTGEVIDRLSLKKAPDLIIEQDGKLYVHTYSYNYVIGMDVPNEF